MLNLSTSIRSRSGSFWKEAESWHGELCHLLSNFAGSMWTPLRAVLKGKWPTSKGWGFQVKRLGASVCLHLLAEQGQWNGKTAKKSLPSSNNSGQYILANIMLLPVPPSSMPPVLLCV